MRRLQRAINRGDHALKAHDLERINSKTSQTNTGYKLFWCRVNGRHRLTRVYHEPLAKWMADYGQGAQKYLDGIDARNLSVTRMALPAADLSRYVDGALPFPPTRARRADSGLGSGEVTPEQGNDGNAAVNFNFNQPLNNEVVDENLPGFDPNWVNTTQQGPFVDMNMLAQVQGPVAAPLEAAPFANMAMLAQDQFPVATPSVDMSMLTQNQAPVAADFAAGGYVNMAMLHNQVPVASPVLAPLDEMPILSNEEVAALTEYVISENSSQEEFNFAVDQFVN